MAGRHHPHPSRTARVGAIWCVLLLLLLPALANALDDRPLNTYFRETWTTRDGLPHNMVQAIAQTPEGYMWFGTWEGLARYNGLEFEVFDRGNVPALRDNGIRSIYVGRDDTLYVGTSRGGLAIRRGDEWTVMGSADGLPQEDVMFVLEDARGRLWVATEGAGVARIDGDGVTHFRAPHGLSADFVYSLFEARDGAMWAATASGPVRIDGDRVEIFGSETGLPLGASFSFAQTRDGGIYVGTENGLYLHRDGRFDRVAAVPADAVPSLLLDEHGYLWAGTVNHGLLRYDRRVESVESLDSLRGLPNNRVVALRLDSTGSLWVGTNGGLLRLRDAPFTTYTTEHRLSDDYVRTVLQASDGAIWVGTSRGLNRIADGEIRTYTQADGLPGDSILSLMEDADGSLWVGTYASGLARWNGKSLASWTRENGLPGNQVRALARDANGDVWVGTYRGLGRLRNGAIEYFGVAQGLSRDFILSLHAAADGRLWIGTTDGAAVMEAGRIRPVNLIAMDDARDVFGFHEDDDGALWMATDRGLVLIRGDRLALIGIRQGLPVETIFQVVDDGQGHFWLTSNRGVIRIRREEALAVADGLRNRLGEVDLFGEGDGLASAQCNGGSGPTAMRANDGRVWLATAKGVAVTDPSRLANFSRGAPPVVIEHVFLDDQPVALDQTLRIPAGSRKLELHYAGISHRMPRQIRFRYRLDGFDPDWVERGGLRSAQFTNLAPGEYRFRVSAAYAGGAWNQDEAMLDIVVEPFWHQRAELRAAMVLLALLLGVTLWRWRMRHLQARERRLRLLVEERTRELREQAERLRAADKERSDLALQLQRQTVNAAPRTREDTRTVLKYRHEFDQRLASAFVRSIERSAPLCLALVEIDPPATPEMLAAAVQLAEATGAVIRRECRPNDVVARYGEGRYALLFPDTTLPEARMLCEHLRTRVAECGNDGLVAGPGPTLSIGLAERSGLNHHEKMLARAEARLHEARQSGHNHVAG